MDLIEILGRNNGISFRIVRESDFEQILKALKARIEERAGFFKGAKVTLDLGPCTLSLEQLNTIAKLMSDYGLVLVGVGNGQAPVRAENRRTVPTPGALVVNRTLRSGMTVRHRGDVIVLGDVNPGAEIVASRNIVVMGALRGVARAGCEGDVEAFVAATKLQPTLLQIADVLGRSPDEEGPEPDEHCPEVARIVDNVIVIDKAVRH